MRYRNAKELLDSILGGEALTKDNLESIRSELKEGQYLEFKRGDFLTDGGKATKVLREYVSGFANADGGVLVVGIDEKTTEITPWKHPGRGSVAEWISGVLQPLAGFLTPYPQVQVIEPGPVVVIAVSRAPQYVPTAEGGTLAYYLRFGDKTLRIPDFLLADIFLGRRQQPVLDLKVSPHVEQTGDRDSRSADFTMILWNEGLVSAEDVEVGMVCWSRGKTEPSLSRHLLSHLEIVPPETEGWCLRHIKASTAKAEPLRIAPFTRNQERLTVETLRFPLACTTQLSAAVYVLARQTTPIWFEHRLRVRIPDENWFDANVDEVELEKVVGRRPRVFAIKSRT